jgi:hypothetical protein
MVSSFQWIKDQECIRLAADQLIDDPVLESLNQFTQYIYCLHKRSAEDYTSLILKVLFNNPELTCAKLGKEVVAEAALVIDFVGVVPRLIGTPNLAAVAYALVIRRQMPTKWNHFCEAVDRIEWQAVQVQQSGGVSRSVGTPSTRNSADAIYRRPVDTLEAGDTEEHEVIGGQVADPGEQQGQPQLSGLVTAFNNADFRKQAVELLDTDRNEDLEAERTVITGADSIPTKCSRYHRVIQEKYSSARYTKKGRRGV